MQIDTAKLTKNWKTTANGLLSAAALVVIAEMAVPTGAKPLVYVLAGLRVLVGLVQTDAGSTEAVLPGSAAAQIVPSHEIPDDPKAVPVNEK